jgi:cytochrome c2
MKTWNPLGWRRLALAMAVALACSSPFGQSQQAAPAGDEGYAWNAMQAEKLRALRATGDASRGVITFEICQGCHRVGALGRADGTTRC